MQEKKTAEHVVPYGKEMGTKREQVEQMFDSISGKYDFLNHFLSMGIDRLWRKKSLRQIQNPTPQKILDVATGTGDFAIAALELNPTSVTGVDISEGMLAVGKEKIKKKGIENIIGLELGDSENLRFNDNTFDAYTVGFGVRNFENLEKGLTEMLRVLKPNGTAIILEFSKPKVFPIKQIYNFYFNKMLPGIGKIVSKDNAAYTYLPESVDAFPDGKDFTTILEKIGYKNTKTTVLMFGIASIYKANK